MSCRLWRNYFAFFESWCGCKSSRSGCTLHKYAQMTESVNTKIKLMLQPPNQWPRPSLSLVRVGRSLSLISPKGSGRAGTSQISSTIHPYSCCYLTLRLKSFIFPKCTRYLNSQGWVSIISAAVCSFILHLGKASSSNAPWSGKALCIPPQLGTSSLVHILVAHWLRTVPLWLGLCFWLGIHLLHLVLGDVIANPEWSPLMFALLSLVFPADLNLSLSTMGVTIWKTKG